MRPIIQCYALSNAAALPFMRLAACWRTSRCCTGDIRDQAAISFNERPHPAQMPESSSLQTLMQGELDAGSVIKAFQNFFYFEDVSGSQILPLEIAKG